MIYLLNVRCCCLVTKSRPTLCDPPGLQHARLPCASLSPRVCSNSCPFCQWCHPTISSSVAPFSSCLQSFPASGSFPMSQFFASGGQSIGASASAPVLLMNIQDWFSLGLTDLICLLSKGLSRTFSPSNPRPSQLLPRFAPLSTPHQGGEKKSFLHSASGNITANRNGILDRFEHMIKGMACLTGRIWVVSQNLQ